MNKQLHNLRIQKWVAIVSALLLAVKITAWYVTNSIAILTDALESVVNVVASLIGLYSLYLAAKPRDSNHPYGHGKAEFISAAIEGTLIGTAGCIILYKAISSFFIPAEIRKLDTGVLLVAITAVVNYMLGIYCVKTGKNNHSVALQASGKHLISDTWSTAGIIAGLILVYFTKQYWLDSAVSILFGLIIIITSYKILRDAIAGIMDEADINLLNKMVELLNSNRRPRWIDLHNLRVIKYGSILHVDCHLTLPWYLSIQEAHTEVDALSALVRNHFGEQVELFVHTDACTAFSCKICVVEGCEKRQFAFKKQIHWNIENILENKQHELREVSFE